MPWYAASAILYAKFKGGRQNEYPVWENVYLIQAPTREKALKKAARLGREDSGDFSGSYTYNKRPATLVFAGIRRLLKLFDPEGRPKDGTEITSFQLLIKKREDLKKLAAGGPVRVLYRD